MWKITRNTQCTTCLPTSPDFDLDVELPFKFKIFDNDDVLYLEGYSDDCSSDYAFEPLDDYGEPALGATDIHYLNPKTGKYEPL